MCGRYVRQTPLQKLARLLGAINALPELKASYNIAPTQPMLIARIGADGKRELALVRWGWVPHWAKTVEGTGPVTINARSETVDEKPAFRDAFKYRRCVVPADGFYEWDRSTQPRQPYYFYLAPEKPMWLAGLWEHWQDAHGNELETGVILTSQAMGAVAKIHHRMPVLLDDAMVNDWLSPGGSYAVLMKVLGRTLPTTSPMPLPVKRPELLMHPVTVQVNHTRFDEPVNIQPIAGQGERGAAESPSTGTLFD